MIFLVPTGFPCLRSDLDVSKAFLWSRKVREGLFCVEGYEPKARPVKAMERAHSVPSRAPISSAECNPFYSEKVKMELQLEASRPSHLPRRSSGSINLEPIQSSPGVESPLQGVAGQTGKGRGGQSAGLLDALQPTVYGLGPLKSQGALPAEDEQRTMGPGVNSRNECWEGR